jgi:hypothetical protein
MREDPISVLVQDTLKQLIGDVGGPDACVDVQARRNLEIPPSSIVVVHWHPHEQTFPERNQAGNEQSNPIR